MASVAERIRFLRGNFSREEFAASINIKPTTLRNYELGVSLPHAEVLSSICINLKISPAWLLLGEGEAQGQEAALYAENAPEAAPCPACGRMQRHIGNLEAERKELAEEMRQVNADNRRLWQEQGSLLKDLATAREECATLRERLHWIEKKPD